MIIIPNYIFYNLPSEDYCNFRFLYITVDKFRSIIIYKPIPSNMISDVNVHNVPNHIKIIYEFNKKIKNLHGW